MDQPNYPIVVSTRPRRPATRAVTQQRTTEIIRLRNKGASLWDVIEYIAAREKEPGTPWYVTPGADQGPLKRRQVQMYILKADTWLEAQANRDRKRAVARHAGMLRDVYMEARATKDLTAALAALKGLASLHNLEAQGSKGKDDGPITFDGIEIGTSEDEASPDAMTDAGPETGGKLHDEAHA